MSLGCEGVAGATTACGAVGGTTRESQYLISWDKCEVSVDAIGAVWFLDGPTSRRPHRSNDNSEHEHSPHDARLRRSPTRQTILFFAANPTETERLALDREASTIQIELERAGYRDRFELITRWAVLPLDLLRELRKTRPTVVYLTARVSSTAARVRLRAEISLLGKSAANRGVKRARGVAMRRSR